MAPSPLSAAEARSPHSAAEARSPLSAAEARSPLSAAEARAAAPPARNSQVLGALLLLFGGVWMLRETGLVDIGWRAIGSLLLVALGIGLVVTARSRGGGGLVVLGAGLAVALAVSSGVESGKFSFGDHVGGRRFVPLTLDSVENGYEQGVGDLTIDLGEVTFPEGEKEIRVDVGIGDVIVHVPSDVGVKLTANIGAGDISLFGAQRARGVGLDRHMTSANYDLTTKRVHFFVNIGLGDLAVVGPIPGLVTPTAPSTPTLPAMPTVPELPTP